MSMSLCVRLMVFLVVVTSAASPASAFGPGEAAGGRRPAEAIRALPGRAISSS